MHELQLVHHIVVGEHPQFIGLMEGNRILVDDDLVQVISLPFAFKNDGGIAETRHRLRRRAPRVRLLDAAGQRALAAHGKTTGRGCRRAAHESGSEHQLVLGSERMAGGGNFLADHGGRHRATAQPGVFAKRFHGGLGAAFGTDVDTQNLIHVALLFSCDWATAGHNEREALCPNKHIFLKLLYSTRKNRQHVSSGIISRCR